MGGPYDPVRVPTHAPDARDDIVNRLFHVALGLHTMVGRGADGDQKRLDQALADLDRTIQEIRLSSLDRLNEPGPDSSVRVDRSVWWEV